MVNFLSIWIDWLINFFSDRFEHERYELVVLVKLIRFLVALILSSLWFIMQRKLDFSKHEWLSRRQKRSLRLPPDCLPLRKLSEECEERWSKSLECVSSFTSVMRFSELIGRSLTGLTSERSSFFRAFDIRPIFTPAKNDNRLHNDQFSCCCN